MERRGKWANPVEENELNHNPQGSQAGGESFYQMDYSYIFNNPNYYKYLAF